jgi:hypothetical protein
LKVLMCALQSSTTADLSLDPTQNNKLKTIVWYLCWQEAQSGGRPPGFLKRMLLTSTQSFFILKVLMCALQSSTTADLSLDPTQNNKLKTIVWYLCWQEAQSGGRPPGFLKRMLLTSTQSSAAAEPPTLPTTTPIKEQDVEKVSRKKMNLVTCPF